ncbi:F-box protein CPR1 [Bienertia sinuspersici]
MAALPTNIIVEILSKLPVKSLLRFQCICKSWQSLIKSPYFIKIQFNQTLTSHSNLHLLASVEHSSLHCSELDLCHDQVSFSFSALHHPLKPRQPITIVGSYNGVVCISNISKSDVCLYNPLTKSHRKLPASKMSIPNINMTVFGFGYDRNNDDYKVLRIVQGLGKIDDSKNKAEVFSLQSNSRKSIQGIPYSLYYGYYVGVLVNEALHCGYSRIEF